MFNNSQTSGNKLGLATTTIAIMGSMLSLSATASATTLKVTFTSVTPINGIGVAQLWAAAHDGTFDPFNSGETASRAIELLAEDGFIGNEGRVPGLLPIIQAAGLDLNKISPELRAAVDAGVDLTQFTPSDSLAGLFARSTAAQNGGVQEILFPFSTTPRFLVLLRSGESISTTLNVTDPNINRFFSYAGMLFPTNDTFIANDDPMGIEIFDAQGNFLGADFTVFGAQAWNAGTEVNDEGPNTVPYNIVASIGNSVDEGGVIHPFPIGGIKPPGSGGIVDLNFRGQKLFENGDFARSNYPLVRISVRQVSTPEPDSIMGLLTAGGVFLLSGCWKLFQRYFSK